MVHWFFIAVLITMIVASGCASLQKSNSSPPLGIPSALADREQTQIPSRLPPPRLDGDEVGPIRPVNHFEEAATDSQETPFGPTTTLGELIAFALANNPEIRAIRMQARALQSRVPQVRALDDPMLMTTTFLQPIQTAAGPQDVMLSISQKLPWFGKRTLRGNVAFHEAQTAFARMAAAELAVVEHVKLAYYELYFLNRSVEVHRELELRLEDMIAIAKRKYETAGDKTGLETVLQAQVELAQLQTVFVQLEQAKEKTYAQLAKALHAPRGVSFDFDPSLREVNVHQSADVLVALIDQCQPKLDGLRREMNRDRSTIAVANKNHYPDVTLGFNWHAIGSTGLSRVATGDDAYSLMVGVNLPIYREKLDASVREAQFKAARTSQMYDSVWDEIRAEVQTLHAQAIEHGRIVKILDGDIVPKAKQTLDLSTEAYRVDRITFQQLIENYKTLLRYRLDYYRRLTQREQALAMLERAVGCAITTWPIQLEEAPIPQEL